MLLVSLLRFFFMPLFLLAWLEGGMRLGALSLPGDAFVVEVAEV